MTSWLRMSIHQCGASEAGLAAGISAGAEIHLLAVARRTVRRRWRGSCDTISLLRSLAIGPRVVGAVVRTRTPSGCVASAVSQSVRARGDNAETSINRARPPSATWAANRSCDNPSTTVLDSRGGWPTQLRCERVDDRRLRAGCVSCALRNLRDSPLHRQSGWRHLREGSGESGNQRLNRCDPLRSGQIVRADTAEFHIACLNDRPRSSGMVHLDG